MSDDNQDVARDINFNRMQRTIDHIWKWAQSTKSDPKVDQVLANQARIEAKIDASTALLTGFQQWLADAIVQALTAGATQAQLDALAKLHTSVSEKTDDLATAVEAASDKPT